MWQGTLPHLEITRLSRDKYNQHTVMSEIKDAPNRASESVVFNSDQKMALRAVYEVIC